MAELGVDGRRDAVLVFAGAACFLRDFPNREGAVIATRDEELLFLEDLSDNAGDRVHMVATFRRLENDRAANLKVP